MGNPLFGVDIASLVAQHVGSGLLDVVVTRYTAASRDPDNLTAGTSLNPTTVRGIKGVWEDVPRSPPAGVEVELNDRVALLIGDTIPAGGRPLRNDAITIAGETLYCVQLIERDPADAAFRYLCRDRRGPDGE